jgi:lysophospholipase
MDLFDLPENPIPPGTVVSPVVTEDGVTLRAARWPATHRPVRGTVCIFPGRGEQIEKYFRVVEDLRRRGFAVAAMDWRGQGGSARLLRNTRKGHVGRFSDYWRDIAAFRRQIVLPDCPPPYFGLAHSMGGHIVLAGARDLVPWLSRLVVTAPMLDFGRIPLSRPALRRITGTLCAMGLGRMSLRGEAEQALRTRNFDTNVLTSDPVMHRIMMDVTALRPDLGIGPPTARWLNEAARSMDRMDEPDFPASIPMPVLLINSGADTVVSVAAIERFARRMRTVGYVLVPGAKHEIMMEREAYRAQFWAAFDAFVPGSRE